MISDDYVDQSMLKESSSSDQNGDASHSIHVATTKPSCQSLAEDRTTMNESTVPEQERSLDPKNPVEANVIVKALDRQHSGNSSNSHSRDHSNSDLPTQASPQHITSIARSSPKLPSIPNKENKRHFNEQRRYGGNQANQHSQDNENTPLLNEQILDEEQSKIFALNMKRFILICLGIPDNSKISMGQAICMGSSILIYMALFVWGIVIICSVAMMFKDDQLHPRVGIASALSGSYFVFLGLYWLLVYWWSRMAKGKSRTITFTFLTTLWICLCLYFMGVACTLGTEMFEHYYFSPPDSKAQLQCNATVIHYRNYAAFVPVLSFGSMLGLWIVYIAIFILNILYVYIE